MPYITMIAYTNYSSDARVRREAEAVAEQPGYHVSFMSLKEGRVETSYNANGVAVQEVPIRKYQGKSKKAYMMSYARFMAVAFQELNRQVFAGCLDAVHIHNMPNFLVLSAVIPRLAGKKLILDIHDSIPETYLSKFSDGNKNLKLFKLFCIEENLCCRFVHKVVCVNHIQKQVLVQRGLEEKKVVVCMNTPDPKIFHNDMNGRISRRNANEFRLVYHGTITERLGIDLVIEAVSKLKDEISNLHYYVLGKGDDLDTFVRLAEKRGVGDRVHFNKKMLPVECLGELICEMDLGVISNRKDPATELMLPVKMLEYMVLGIPVIAPRLKTIQYYFDEKMICYYDPENIESLVDSIRIIYQNKNRQKEQTKAANRFFHTYGWNQHKMGLIQMYREMLKGK